MVYGVMRQLGGGLQDRQRTWQRHLRHAVPAARPFDCASQKSLEPRFATGPVSLLLVDDDPSTQAMVAAFAAELVIP